MALKVKTGTKGGLCQKPKDTTQETHSSRYPPGYLRMNQQSERLEYNWSVHVDLVDSVPTACGSKPLQNILLHFTVSITCSSWAGKVEQRQRTYQEWACLLLLFFEMSFTATFNFVTLALLNRVNQSYSGQLQCTLTAIDLRHPVIWPTSRWRFLGSSNQIYQCEFDAQIVCQNNFISAFMKWSNDPNICGLKAYKEITVDN